MVRRACSGSAHLESRASSFAVALSFLDADLEPHTLGARRHREDVVDMIRGSLRRRKHIDEIDRLLAISASVDRTGSSNIGLPRMPVHAESRIPRLQILLTSDAAFSGPWSRRAPRSSGGSSRSREGEHRRGGPWLFELHRDRFASIIRCVVLDKPATPCCSATQLRMDGTRCCGGVERPRSLSRTQASPREARAHEASPRASLVLVAGGKALASPAFRSLVDSCVWKDRSSHRA